MNGCAKVRDYTLDASGTGDPTETLEIDLSQSPQASQQQYTTSFNLDPRWGRKRGDRDICDVAIWKQMSKKLETVGDNWIGETSSGPRCLIESC